jgi:hypothetical protein
LPATYRDLVVAQVRVVEGPNYLVGRDQSGKPPPPAKDLFFARIEIIAVMEGNAAAGSRYGVRFGTPDVGRLMWPHTPRMKSLSYFVVSYVGEDNQRRLLGIPAREQEYRV